MGATTDLKYERDALGFIGVLAHAYLTWDPPIAAGMDAKGKPDFTHFAGLNIHALVVDNSDGEVLAIERNTIHEAEDPTRHAEQAAIRAAMIRLRAKRPRQPGVSVERYYRSQLFYAPGAQEEDYVTRGCSLYTTLEPCPLCTATICVSRMKRTVFVIRDNKFGKSYPVIKPFYKDYELAYEGFAPTGESRAAALAKSIWGAMEPAVERMRQDDLQDTWFLDRLHEPLSVALKVLTELGVGDVVAKENATMLLGLKRLCRLPA